MTQLATLQKRLAEKTIKALLATGKERKAIVENMNAIRKQIAIIQKTATI